MCPHPSVLAPGGACGRPTSSKSLSLRRRFPDGSAGNGQRREGERGCSRGDSRGISPTEDRQGTADSARIKDACPIRGYAPQAARFAVP